MSVGTILDLAGKSRISVSVPYVRDVRWDSYCHAKSSRVSVPYVRDVRWDTSQSKAGRFSVSVPYVRDVRWDT